MLFFLVCAFHWEHQSAKLIPKSRSVASRCTLLVMTARVMKVSNEEVFKSPNLIVPLN